MTCTCEPIDQIPFEDFLPYILPSVKGLPAQIAAHNARLAAIQFGRETGIFERTMHLYAQEGVTEYYVDPGDCYSILSIRCVSVHNCLHEPLRRPPNYMYGRKYFFEKPNKLYVSHVGCDEDRGIEVIAKVVPGQDSCFVDRCAYDVYAEAIQWGALERIHMMHSADWYDPPLARAYGLQFAEATTDASVLVTKKFSSEAMYLRGKRFV